MQQPGKRMGSVQKVVINEDIFFQCKGIREYRKEKEVKELIQKHKMNFVVYKKQNYKEFMISIAS